MTAQHPHHILKNNPNLLFCKVIHTKPQGHSGNFKIKSLARTINNRIRARGHIILTLIAIGNENSQAVLQYLGFRFLLHLYPLVRLGYSPIRFEGKERKIHISWYKNLKFYYELGDSICNGQYQNPAYITVIKTNEQTGRLNDIMESKGGKKSSSSSKSQFYEAPLGYSIEDVRPNGGIKKFRSAAYSNCARKPS
ncbi:hypothetical protein CsSME_00037125 [Camellia sinensis var. sinensis]